MRVAVLASGRGSNLQALIDSSEMEGAPFKLSAVISDKKDSLALKRACKHGLKGYFLNPKDYCCREDFDSALAQLIKRKNIDLICLAGFMRILSSEFIACFSHSIINIHPSLLPSFPGLEAQKQALDYGVKYTGCTVHFVDEGVDTGPVIDQRVVPIYDNDTVESLSSRILKEEHVLYPRVVKGIARGLVEINGRKVIFHKGGS